MPSLDKAYIPLGSTGPTYSTTSAESGAGYISFANTDPVGSWQIILRGYGYFVDGGPDVNGAFSVSRGTLGLTVTVPSVFPTTWLGSRQGYAVNNDLIVGYLVQKQTSTLPLIIDYATFFVPLPSRGQFDDATNVNPVRNICPGTTLGLVTSFDNFTYAEVDNGIGIVADVRPSYKISQPIYDSGISHNGSLFVSPTVDTTYTLTVHGFYADVKKSIFVHIIPAATITAGVTWKSSCSAAAGVSPVLNWSSTNALQVDIYIGSSIYRINAGLSGSLDVTQAPGTSTTYTFVASPASCTATRTNVIVQQPAGSGYIDAGTALFTALVSTSLSSPSLTGVPPTAKSLSSLSLTQDATRRPAVGGGLSSVIGYVSKDAGHTYLNTTLDAAGTDASLLIDTRRNRFRVIYSKANALVQVSGEMQEGYVLDAGGPVALAGMGGGAAPTGAYPVAVPHPADKDYTLMAYLSGGVLWSAGSYDGGVSWRTQAAIAGGLDFTPTGRAALAMIGESAFIAYASGNNLYAAAGADRGNSWTAPGLAATSGPYTGLSLLASQGRLYLLAFTGSTPAPVLFVSPDLGATWAQVTSTFPAITPPSGIGVVPTTGRLRLGLTHTSGDDGHTWAAA